MELTLGVTLAVLGAGLLHAGWNALLKSAGGGDPLLDTATVVAGSTACSLVALPFVPLPDRGAWPFIAASTCIHFGYYLTLAQAYRTGDLSFAYPLMRGTAPLLVTLLGVVFLRELPPPQVIAGIAADLRSASSASPSRGASTIRRAAGVLGARQRRDHRRLHAGRRRRRARFRQRARATCVWLTFLEGIVFLAWIRRRRGAPARRAMSASSGAAASLGGFCSVAAYAHRAVGDDARADRRGLRAARDLGDVRRADRRRAG